MSSSAKAWRSNYQSKTGGRTSSLAMASSTFALTRRRHSRKSTASCVQVDGSNSLTSQTANPYPSRRSGTSISGRPELPVVCRVQPGKKCWKRPASLTFILARQSTPSKVRKASRRLGYSRSTATRSSRESQREQSGDALCVRRSVWKLSLDRHENGKATVGLDDFPVCRALQSSSPTAAAV
jgi:hypothetical protein